MADPAATSFPPPIAKITINAGLIHIEYEGPPDYLKEIPALIEELHKAIQGTTAASAAPQ